MSYFIKRSFRKDFRIIFLRENIEFKKNYIKRQGLRVSTTGLRGNGSRPWAGAGRGDETGKEKHIGCGKLGLKI
jgi:hypothetical protein